MKTHMRSPLSLGFSCSLSTHVNICVITALTTPDNLAFNIQYTITNEVCCLSSSFVILCSCIPVHGHIIGGLEALK